MGVLGIFNSFGGRLPIHSSLVTLLVFKVKARSFMFNVQLYLFHWDLGYCIRWETRFHLFFWPHLKAGFQSFFLTWRSTFSHGLLYLPYFFRFSGLPCYCITGWRILINFHFEARRRVVRIRFVQRNAEETKCEHWRYVRVKIMQYGKKYFFAVMNTLWAKVKVSPENLTFCSDYK